MAIYVWWNMFASSFVKNLCEITHNWSRSMRTVSKIRVFFCDLLGAGRYHYLQVDKIQLRHMIRTKDGKYLYE